MRIFWNKTILYLFLIVLPVTVCMGQDDKKKSSRNTVGWEDVEFRMKPFSGKSIKGIDRSTLTGKVMCGYQGWFHAEGDGANVGWIHYGKGAPEPGACSIDFWPDMSEMDDDEKYATSFEHADGSTAYLFSSGNRKTVMRHFKWMKEHGIDGVFLQRFGSSTRKPVRAMA